MSEKPMQTRAQRDLSLAMTKIQEVAAKYPSTDDPARKIYGGLCHSFPVLVQQCGLCQALAFSEAKASKGKERGAAHQLLLDHVAALLGEKSAAELVERLRTEDTLDYMDDTRRVIGAWIYFKRFAVSILGIESAQDAEESGEATP